MSQYVLEWSRTGNCFYIKTVEDALAGNQEAFLDNGIMDRLPLMIGSHEACLAMSKNHQARLDVRAAPKW